MDKHAYSKLFLTPIILCLLTALIFGCKPWVTRPDKTELLQTRISRFIEAQNSGDLETTYRFYNRGFRDQFSLVNYIKENSGTPVKMDLAAIAHEAGSDTADVTMLGHFFMMGFEIKGIEMAQHWVFEDGDWFIEASPPVSMETLFMNTGKTKGKKK